MPQRDLYRPPLRAALIRDGWTITHDPLTVPFGLRKVCLDLGAERLLAAERGSEQIAVEIKSFIAIPAVAYESRRAPSACPRRASCSPSTPRISGGIHPSRGGSPRPTRETFQAPARCQALSRVLNPRTLGGAIVP
jgi:hypothetical protein